MDSLTHLLRSVNRVVIVSPISAAGKKAGKKTGGDFWWGIDRGEKNTI